MRDPDDVAALAEAAAERYGSVDVLVNNAGVQTETAADEATLDDWAFVVETDFRAYWLAARAALEHMDRGAIVNISSNHAYATMPAHFPYNAVKAGINGMTRSLAVDFWPRVRVNTVVPGWVEIERTREELPEGRFEEVESIHPTGRIGTPSDVAGTVSFLASEDAAFVTGCALLVDGGRGAVMQDDTLPRLPGARALGVAGGRKLNSEIFDGRNRLRLSDSQPVHAVTLDDGDPVRPHNNTVCRRVLVVVRHRVETVPISVVNRQRLGIDFGQPEPVAREVRHPRAAAAVPDPDTVSGAARRIGRPRGRAGLTQARPLGQTRARLHSK